MIIRALMAFVGMSLVVIGMGAMIIGIGIPILIIGLALVSAALDWPTPPRAGRE